MKNNMKRAAFGAIMVVATIVVMHMLHVDVEYSKHAVEFMLVAIKILKEMQLM